MEEPIQVPRLRRRRQVPMRLVAGSVAVVAVIGYVAWAGFSGGASPSTALSPGVAHAAAPVKHVAIVAPKPAIARPLLIAATNGSCWLEVRKGGPTGSVLYKGTLAEGAKLHFAAAKVWLRAGAPSVLTVSRGAKHIGGLLTSGPLDLIA